MLNMSFVAVVLRPAYQALAASRLVTPSSVLTASVLVMAGVLGVIAGWTDLRSRRIPNWLTVSGAAVGLALNTAAFGWAGSILSLEGIGLGLLILLPLVALRGIGAGDWKLVGAIGSFVGPRPLLLVLAGAVLIAGIMAVALVIYKRRVLQTGRNLGRLLFALATGHPGDPSISLDNPEAAKVPFGVAAAISVILFVSTRLALRASF
jgi:prepilin peptidase CpaA